MSLFLSLSINGIVGGSSSVCRELGWEPESRWFKSPYGPKYGGGEVPVHLLGTAKVFRVPFHGQLPHSDISPLVHV